MYKLMMLHVAILICGATSAWATEVGTDKKYLPHGPAITSELETGLHKIAPCFAKGIWPSNEMIAARKDRSGNYRNSTGIARVYVKRVIAKDFRPSVGSDIIGLRGMYTGGGDAILLAKALHKHMVVQVTLTTGSLTATFKSAKILDWEPEKITKEVLLEKFGVFLNIPQEQLAKARVEIKQAKINDKKTIVHGVVHVPSPEKAGQGAVGRKWYNSIAFWADKGSLFVAVFPQDGVVARPETISFDPPKPNQECPKARGLVREPYQTTAISPAKAVASTTQPAATTRSAVR